MVKVIYVKAQIWTKPERNQDYKARSINSSGTMADNIIPSPNRTYFKDNSKKKQKKPEIDRYVESIPYRNFARVVEVW